MNRNIETSLINKALRGDEQAFAEVYMRLRDSIYGFTFRMLSDSAAAEDVTQETFIFLIEDPNKFDPERGSLHPFLCGVARNLTLHYLRKRENRYRDFDEFDEFIETKDETNLNPLEILLETELVGFVNECVAELPRAQREVIILRELQGFSYDEIAEIIEADLNLVKVRLHRARKNLAEKLAPYLKKRRNAVNCIEVRKNLEAFADEEIEVFLRREISAHLNICDSCRDQFAELDFVGSLLKKELPAFPDKKLDARVMAAFGRHHARKNVWNWSAIFSSFFTRKPAFSLLTLCFLIGAAFLAGRMTVPKPESFTAEAPQIVEKQIPVETIKYVEVPTTRYVEIPVEKERIVTRIVYRNIEIPRTKQSTIVSATNSCSENGQSSKQLTIN